MRSLLCLLVLLVPAWTQTLQQRLQREIDASPAASRAYWGFQVLDPASGKLLASLNADRFFRPASNNKLFTSALALMRLGPRHTFQTVVRAAQAPDAEGRITGDLALIGGGDPTLSGRDYPYRHEGPRRDPLSAIEAFADQVVAAGVQRLDGDVVGDDTAYVWDPIPEGWTHDDTLWGYGVPVSALSVADNLVLLTMSPPHGFGLRPRISFSPPLPYYVVENRVRYGPNLDAEGTVQRVGRQLILAGTTSDVTQQIEIAIDDPALYAAMALRDALQRRGVVVNGNAVARHRHPGEPPPPAPSGGVELARRTSPPLIEILRALNKVSQNLHAELALLETARVRRGDGRRDWALEERKQFLASAGIAESDSSLADGSGLARQNLVSPAAVVRLLRHMYASPQREDWIALLPIGGEDGTLSDRYAGEANGKRIHAKTGTLTGVSALSGYAETEGGGRLAFSIFANNYNAPTSQIREVIDRLALRITETTRSRKTVR